MTKEERNDPYYRQGYVAQENGLELLSMPHAIGSDEGNAYVDGWMAAWEDEIMMEGADGE